METNVTNVASALSQKAESSTVALSQVLLGNGVLHVAHGFCIRA